ncbi:MAG: hypothetical protein ACLTXL_09695 [Clostridia bacterium]
MGYIVSGGKEFWNLLDMVFTDEFMRNIPTLKISVFPLPSAVMVNWGGDYGLS